MNPDTLWGVSLMLLLAAALSLLSPALGGPVPPLGAIAALLLLRLGVLMWRARQLGEGQNMTSLALSVLLTVLLLWTAGTQGTGRGGLP